MFYEFNCIFVSRYEADSLYFQADDALNKRDFALARVKLEEALNADPGHTLALNALGWLYERKYYDYDKAEKCYVAGLKIEPNQPSLNINYAYLLSVLDDFDGFDAHYENAVKVKGLNVARLKGEYAATLEKRGEFERALEIYNEALRLSVSNDDIDLIEGDIKRVKGKIKSLKSKV